MNIHYPDNVVKNFNLYSPDELSRLLFWYMRQPERKADLIKSMFTAGAIPNAMEPDGRTYLSFASTVEEVDAINASGAPVNLRHKRREITALHMAAFYGKFEVCQRIAEVGGNLRLHDHMDRNIIWFAKYSLDRAEIGTIISGVKKLLERYPAGHKVEPTTSDAVMLKQKIDPDSEEFFKITRLLLKPRLESLAT